MTSSINNILFVCSANKQRSKTAEDYFSTLYTHLNFASCGTNINLCNNEGTTAITPELTAWADIIFVMENKHAHKIKHLLDNTLAKVIVLNIRDVYKYYQKELLDILSEKTRTYLLSVH